MTRFDDRYGFYSYAIIWCMFESGLQARPVLVGNELRTMNCSQNIVFVGKNSSPPLMSLIGGHSTTNRQLLDTRPFLILMKLCLQGSLVP